MKSISLVPVNRRPSIHTNDRLLDALLVEELDVLMACGGRGRCATCRVIVEEGMEKLSPIERREQRTLGRLSGCGPETRLACQARVLGEGVRVRLPRGMYIGKNTRAEDLVGRRARVDIIHPITGEVLVQEGKIVTRTFIMKLENIQMDLESLANET